MSLRFEDEGDPVERSVFSLLRDLGDSYAVDMLLWFVRCFTGEQADGKAAGALYPKLKGSMLAGYLRLPDGDSIRLLAVPDWRDPSRFTLYYKKPKDAKKSTKIACLATTRCEVDGPARN